MSSPKLGSETPQRITIYVAASAPEVSGLMYLKISQTQLCRRSSCTVRPSCGGGGGGGGGAGDENSRGGRYRRATAVSDMVPVQLS
eukprot:SAG31_NODE_1001_length_10455_cov_12.021727_3_plen_86_part_00